MRLCRTAGSHGSTTHIDRLVYRPLDISLRVSGALAKTQAVQYADKGSGMLTRADGRGFDVLVQSSCWLVECYGFLHAGRGASGHREQRHQSCQPDHVTKFGEGQPQRPSLTLTRSLLTPVETPSARECQRHGSPFHSIGWVQTGRLDTHGCMLKAGPATTRRPCFPSYAF